MLIESNGGSSMKIFFMLFMFILNVHFAHADCGTTSCYDYCTSAYITVDGDSCTSAYDYGRGCYAAYGYCESGGCGSQTTTCYDYCTSSYITVPGDSCETNYDYNRGCYAASGKCSKDFVSKMFLLKK
jgi:hypothetical protein